MSLNVLSSSRNRLSTHDLGRVTSNSSISSGKSESHGVRASIEGAIDKLKSHGSAKDDDDEEHNRREKLKELLPSRVVSKRRRKKKLEKAEQTSIARGSKVAERGTLDDSKSLMEMKSSGSSGSLGTTVSNASLSVQPFLFSSLFSISTCCAARFVHSIDAWSDDEYVIPS